MILHLPGLNAEAFIALLKDGYGIDGRVLDDWILPVLREPFAQFGFVFTVWVEKLRLRSMFLDIGDKITMWHRNAGQCERRGSCSGHCKGYAVMKGEGGVDAQRR